MGATQRHARLGGDGTFRKNLEADNEVVAKLGNEVIAQCFNLDHALAHVDLIVERALTTG